MNLKQKAIHGALWSFFDAFASQGIQFFVGILLARLLLPHEFGIIGMITVFIAISQLFISSGFSNALIRKQDCTQLDYSTVFFFNLFISVLFFFLINILSETISSFFKEPQIENVLRALSFGLIIESISIIQRTILTKQVNFKLQTRISLIAGVIAGVVAVFCAYHKFGVWSLVALQLVRQTITAFLLWLWNKWTPSLIFSRKSFKELFGFGSKLLLSVLIDTIYKNMYYFIIGKYFSIVDLGYYTRADQFKNLASQNITSVIQRVSYPVLAAMQNDTNALKSSYRNLIRVVMFVTFLIMLGIASSAKQMVITLIGEKWLPSVIYLQMLCVVGMLYPLQAINLNMLNVRGRSDLVLRIEVIKKILSVPAIIIGALFSIKGMIAGMIFNSVIAYFLNSYWSGKLIDYHASSQIKDIFPAFLFALINSTAMYFIGETLGYYYTLAFIIQIVLGVFFVVVVSELIGFYEYNFLKNILKEKIIKQKYATSI